MHNFKNFTLILLFFSSTSLFAQTFDGCITIDFEEIPGAIPVEGLSIDNQYFAQFGLTFVLENGIAPVLAEVGAPTTAFGSSFGDGQDTPAPGQNIGSFFLTDDGRLSGLSSTPLLLNFVNPIDSFGGCILDMDFGETFFIEAMDINGQLVLSETIRAGDPNTGDGLSTCWGFNLNGCEGSVYSIRFSGSRQQSGSFGLGLDNFSFCTTGVDIATQIDVESERLSCTNTSSSITINNRGTAVYEYSIDGVNFQSSPFFDDLAPGSYNITVRNTDGCLAEWTVDIAPYVTPWIVGTEATPTNCDEDNGIIVVSANASNVLQYSIDGGISFQSDSVFTQLPPGFYEILVTDDVGCSVSQIETVDQIAPLEITTAVATDDFCGDSNGTVTVSTTGGSGVITYAVSSNPGIFQQSNVITGLPAGIYTVEAMDELGCSTTSVFEVAPGIPILTEVIPDIDNLNCHDATGSITLMNTGPNVFQYSLDGFTYQSSPVFDNLPQGVYTVFIQDQNNCIANINLSIQAYVPLALVDMTVNHTTCGDENGSLSVIPNANNGITYSLNGGTFQEENFFDDLAPASYLLTVSDEDNCTYTTNIIIDPSESPIINQVSVKDDICDENNGTISISASGGTGVLSYSINGGALQVDNGFINLDGGAYSLLVQDEEGCTDEGTAELINTPPLVLGDVLITTPDCDALNGSLKPLISGGTGTLFYALNGGMLQRQDSFTNLAPGAYSILISDEVGCQAETQVIVPLPRCPIYIPNIFTPNDDGNNDLFKIFTTNLYDVQVIKYAIFDRWGELVWESGGFTINTGKDWWDGRFKNEYMNTGVFVYMISVEHLDGYQEVFSGDITLMK